MRSGKVSKPAGPWALKHYHSLGICKIYYSHFTFWGNVSLLCDLLPNWSKFTKWQLFLVKTTTFLIQDRFEWKNGSFVNLLMFFKRSHNSDFWLSLTHDSNLSWMSRFYRKIGFSDHVKAALQKITKTGSHLRIKDAQSI